MPIPATLTSLAALEQYPHLREQVEDALQRQAQHIAERNAFYVERPDAEHDLNLLIAAHRSGLIMLAGPPGAGVSTLLCHLAATRPAACWFPSQSGKAGFQALCAQVIALCDLPFALVPPAAARDASVLERLLAEAGAARPHDAPLLVLLDSPFERQAFANLLPASIPAGVVVIMARPAAPTFLPAPTAMLMLPAAGAAVLAQLREFCLQCGCRPDEAAQIADQANGSFLYARIVATQVVSAQRDLANLPDNLEALHAHWWQQLDPLDRQVVELLAAARVPIGPAHLGHITGLGAEAHQRAAAWFPLVELTGQGVALHHNWTRAFIERASGDQLAAAHARHARFLADHLERADTVFDTYTRTEYARHVALSSATTRALLAPDLTSRAWIMSQERRFGSMERAAHDMQWAIDAVAGMGPLLLVRAAALGGMLTLLSRRLAPAAVVHSLEVALERGVPREQSVRRIRSMIDQLPDGRDKALLLRALGEVCYTLRMRATAMRMLSEALDLETHGLPRSWRDEREETLVALARAAVTHGWPDTALGITTLIIHAERRGLVDTEVVRWLIAAGQHTRAEEVAYAIGHAGTHEWAMAEVAVGHARAGDFERAGVVFDTLRTDTAIAWAATELGCDSARNGNPRAVDRVAMLRPTALRDRALAQVAHALAAHRMAIEAFAAVTLIEDFDLRLRALVAMAEADPECAPTALSGASRALEHITGDERASAIAVLASTYASTGRLDQALATAALLPPGEEFDRACSRISTALGRRKDHLAASTVAMEIADDDERSWALDELARLVAAGGQWREAFALAAQITDDAQRAHTEADLAIAWARAGQAVAAHARALQISSMAERLRALIAITNELAADGTRAAAFIRFAQLGEPEARSRYLAAAATALAEQGALADAEQAAAQATRPLDRARSGVAIAQAAAEQGQLTVAQSILAEALREVAWLGRSEALACLGWAGETLALLGGADLLLNVASTLDELDSWWSN